jgi:hypothetical protein
MSAAQEEEIRQLTAELEAATSARHAAEAKAEGLQAALFESHLKARAAVEQCRRDALEVAVEEVCMCWGVLLQHRAEQASQRRVGSTALRE